MLKSIKRWLILPLLAAIIFLGPWPIDDPTYQQTDYYRDTLDRLDNHNIDQRHGQYRAGYAQATINPETKTPLAGYSSRKTKTYEGIREDVYARVLSVTNTFNIVSIINLEILLPLPQLVARVVEKTGLPREQLFFTATHTHSGPGGYQDNWLHEMSVGPYQHNYFEYLTDQIASAVTRSRTQMRSVRIEYQRFSPENNQQLLYNELIKEKHGHDSLHILSFFTETEQRLASFLTFSAHPTILGQANHHIDGDYPGELMRLLSAEWKSPVLFGIGAPGAMMTTKRKAKESVEQQIERRDSYAKAVASLFQGTPDIETRADEGMLSTWILDTSLRRPLFHLGEHLQLAPYLPEWLMHSAQSYIHTLHLAGVTVFGMPADYSGELAKSLEQWGEQNACRPIIDSFNGDYIGYLSPSQRYDIPHYTTRDVNFFGRWTGDYFNELAQKICNKYAAHSSKP